MVLGAHFGHMVATVLAVIPCLPLVLGCAVPVDVFEAVVGSVPIPAAPAVVGEAVKLAYPRSCEQDAVEVESINNCGRFFGTGVSTSGGLLEISYRLAEHCSSIQLGRAELCAEGTLSSFSIYCTGPEAELTDDCKSSATWWRTETSKLISKINAELRPYNDAVVANYAEELVKKIDDAMDVWDSVRLLSQYKCMAECMEWEAQCREGRCTAQELTDEEYYYLAVLLADWAVTGQ